MSKDPSVEEKLLGEPLHRRRSRNHPAVVFIDQLQSRMRHFTTKTASSFSTCGNATQINVHYIV